MTDLQKRDLARCREEQRQAREHLSVDPRNARLWLNDQFSEEILILVEAGEV